jgi:UDP-N-acetyl-D-glucosamine dehydrogenase
MRTLNYKTRLIELAGEVNSEMPLFVVTKVQDALNQRRLAVNGSRVLILGVAYKKDVDDVRESPALDIIRLLEAKGADVAFHDPHVRRIREEGRVREGVELSADELARTDCVLIVTDHSAIDYGRLAGIDVPVVDTRNAMKDTGATNVIGLSGRVAAAD